MSTCWSAATSDAAKASASARSLALRRLVGGFSARADFLAASLGARPTTIAALYEELSQWRTRIFPEWKYGK